MRAFLILVFGAALLTACRSSKVVGHAVGRKDSAAKAAAASNAAKNDSAQLVRSMLAAVNANRIDYKTFNAKVDVDYKASDGKNHNVNANIRMVKDSAIWLSVSATVFNVEGVRVIVTKDSVKLLNKVEKTYAARGISFLQETTSLPLNLYTLQDLIIGNPVYIDTNVVRFSRTSDLITLVTLGDLFKNLATFSAADYTVQHSKLSDVDPVRNRTADLSYRDYENKAGVRFASKRQINVSERGHLDIRLDFKNYSFNERLTMPFSVPKNYPRL